METIDLLTPKQIKELENKAINEYKIPELMLMENAAFSTYELVKEKFTGYKVKVLVGPGNNGGDAMALARILYSNGWSVEIFYLKTPNFKSSAKVNYHSVSHIGTSKEIDIDMEEKTIIIDGLFGTGLSREFNDKTKQIINCVNSLNNPIISLDIPSGISALTGEVIGGVAIKANYTISFCAHKIGLYLYPGFNYCGKIFISSISIPHQLINKFKSNIKLNNQVQYPLRSNPCHKASYGKVLVIAGSKNYYGAPLFSSKSSLLSGSGYTTLISSNEVINSLSITAPEIIFKEYDSINEELKMASFVIYGPGLGVDNSLDMLKTILKSNIPALLIDGDGLNLLQELKEEVSKFKGELILTPHPKEASRLLQTDTYTVNKSRINSAKKISQIYNATVVLKGSNSIISTKYDNVFINTTGSTTLSTAGSGDILCGIIAGLSGYMNLEVAVTSGVYFHGRAGQIAEKRIGTIGVTAMDLMESIPEAIHPYQL